MVLHKCSEVGSKPTCQLSLFNPMLQQFLTGKKRKWVSENALLLVILRSESQLMGRTIIWG